MSTDANGRSHVSPGVHIGGQYSVEPKTEPEVALTPADSSSPTGREHGRRAPRTGVTPQIAAAEIATESAAHIEIHELTGQVNVDITAKGTTLTSGDHELALTTVDVPASEDHEDQVLVEAVWTYQQQVVDTRTVLAAEGGVRTPFVSAVGDLVTAWTTAATR